VVIPSRRKRAEIVSDLIADAAKDSETHWLRALHSGWIDEASMQPVGMTRIDRTAFFALSHTVSTQSKLSPANSSTDFERWSEMSMPISFEHATG
jgi:hypothetical protein